MNNSDMPAMPNLEGLDVNDEPYQHTVYTGLTKREHFAAMAMQGMLSNTNEGDCNMHRAGSFCGHLSRNAVEFADALLKELEQ